jgi:DNA invertase Pin-like site-specific DNA recombinase
MADKKALRFAALVRVSSETQEKQGESLQTQRKSNERDVHRLGGVIAGWYGGQEHATPGWEKREVDRLIADAAAGTFDAVIVAYADRWSRDNAKSKEGLDGFRKHGVRFFVGTMELDLFDPQHRFILGMHAEVGEFIALQQTKKSLETRIERAKAGRPACGKLPFGRTFDQKTSEWGIDVGRQAMVEDVARRYLAGESMKELAREYGVNHSHLHKTLMQLCGDEWVQQFVCEALNVRESVKTEIPRLLPEEVIRAVRRRAEGNKTYGRGQDRYKHRYLLGRMVFCARCGYAMSGQYVARNGRRYYRHTYDDRARATDAECCAKGTPRGWVSADDLEERVFHFLFDTFGNPIAVQRAIEAATPNADKVDEARDRLRRLSAELDKLKASRDRVVRFIAKGTIDDADAEAELAELKKRESLLVKESDRLKADIAHAPSPERVKATAERMSDLFRGWSSLWCKADTVNSRIEKMTWEERRALCQLVFGGRDRDGMPLGIYVERDGNGGWRFMIRGVLLDDEDGERWGLTPATGSMDDWEFNGDPLQSRRLKMLERVTGCALRTPTAARWPRRSPGCTAARAWRRSAPGPARRAGSTRRPSPRWPNSATT